MLRKIFTKPVWWWERKRKYPIRFRYLALPPLSVERGPRRFVVLTTPATLGDAMWTTWSWYRYLRPHGFELELAVDGQLSESEKVAAGQLFPDISIYEVETVISPLRETLPALQPFLRGHPLGKKLGLVIALSQKGPVLYSDSDVLAFNRPHELLSHVEKSVPCYIPEEYEGCYDLKIVGRAKALGFECIAKFNSGLLYVPQGALSIDLAIGLLAPWRPPVQSWFSEQTVFNVLMANAKAQPLPSERYVVSVCRQFYWERDVDYETIAARHFTTPVRHVMYRKGMPTILRQGNIHAI
jgi:hypothetical protein